MADSRRLLALSVLLIAAFAFSQSPVLAGDDDFKEVVTRLESHYGAKRMGIPLLGAANFLVKVVRPGGVKSFRVAVFDDHDFSPTAKDAEFDRAIRGLLASKWLPMVRSVSRTEGSRSLIYSRPDGKEVEIMAINFDRRQAVVVQAKVDPEALAHYLENPKIMGFSLAGVSKDRPQKRRTTAAGTSDPAGYPLPAQTRSPESSPRSRPELIRPEEPRAAADRTEQRSSAVASGEEDPGIKLQASVVNLNVKATDRAGNPLRSLTKRDFTITEDGIQQEIMFFEPITAPVNLMLLLDLSGSTQEKRDVMQEASRKFIDSMGPNDSIAVCVFTRDFAVVSDFTTDRTLLKKSLDKIDRIRGGTAYYDAMWKALDLFRSIGDSRKAIVVLTDGLDNSLLRGNQHIESTHSFDQLMSRAAEDEVAIYPIYLDTQSEIKIRVESAEDAGARIQREIETRYRPYQIARQQVEAVAETTGAEVFYARSEKDLEGVYKNVAAELHLFYSLAYSPSNAKNDGTFRSVSVRVGVPGSVVRTRRGYYAK